MLEPGVSLRPYEILGPLGARGETRGWLRVRMSRDGKRSAYTFSQILSDLYLVEGLR